MERTEKGFYKPKYENLGKTKLVRTPLGYSDRVERILEIANQWENKTENPVELLDKFLEMYSKIGQKN